MATVLLREICYPEESQQKSQSPLTTKYSKGTVGTAHCPISNAVFQGLNPFLHVQSQPGEQLHDSVSSNQQELKIDSTSDFCFSSHKTSPRWGTYHYTSVYEEFTGVT